MTGVCSSSWRIALDGSFLMKLKKEKEMTPSPGVLRNPRSFEHALPHFALQHVSQLDVIFGDTCC